MKLLVEKVQFVFGSLDVPSQFSPESKSKYFGKFIAKDKVTITKLKKAIHETAADKFNTVPSDLRDFLSNPDVDKYPEQEGCIVFNAAQEAKPKLFNRKNEAIDVADGIIYAGCIVNVLVSLWGYSYRGTKGISANLLGVQFVEEGTPIGEAASSSDFVTYDDDEETASPLG